MNLPPWLRDWHVYVTAVVVGVLIALLFAVALSGQSSTQLPTL